MVKIISTEILHNSHRFRSIGDSGRLFNEELLEKLDLKAEEVLMIGNDVKEDVKATKAVGIDSILITDCLLGNAEEAGVETMTFAEFVQRV